MTRLGCHHRLVTAVIAAAFIAGACGGSGSNTGDGSSTSRLEPSGGTERATAAADAPVAELMNGFTDAGFALLRTQPENENFVFSPSSIGHGLLMARETADDTTGEAIDAAFALPAGISAHDAWNSFDAELVASNATETAIDDTDSPIVALAGRLWPSTTANPDQAWIDLMATHHGVDVETIDVNDGEAARQQVNGWVSQQTNELVPELLPEGFITPQTVLVLTDAVYFKAQWQTIFGKYGPIDDDFTLLDGSEVPVSLMVQLELGGPRGQGDGFVGAEIPYLGDEYSMLLIVPDEGRFSEVRDRLSTDLLAEIDETFTTGPYELRMPKWETTTDVDLLGWLTDLGIAPGAFPGIGPGVFLGGAVHGADITVDEIGTEAAAATGLGFLESGPPEPELLVAADRPFFYLIRHVGTGAVLFVGQVTNPTE